MASMGTRADFALKRACRIAEIHTRTLDEVLLHIDPALAVWMVESRLVTLVDRTDSHRICGLTPLGIARAREIR